MKEAKTIDEQIEILKQRGLLITDEDKAKECLMDIGFYRLGFYLFPFEKTYPTVKNRTHEFIDNITFNNIVSLYYFDADLRNLLIYYINRIEINLRTYITYTVSNQYKSDPTWFRDPKYVRKDYLDSFEDKIYRTIKGNPVIKRHHEKYHNDRFAPAWKTMEFMTLGNVLSLYKNLKDDNLKERIAKNFGCNNMNLFVNYIETIRVLRNSCAHGACIYNITLSRGIKSGPIRQINDTCRHNICGAIYVVGYILGKISVNRRVEMEVGINKLIDNDRGEALNGIIKRTTGFNVKGLADKK